MDKKVKPLWLALSFLIISAFDARTQGLSQYSAVQRGDNVEVSYRLDGPQGKAFHVLVFASHDNYAAPLKLVEGDTGDKRILPGPSKTIVWKVKEELVNFDGDIAFEIRVVPAAPLFTDITTSIPKVKREKDVTISWKGAPSDDRVSIIFVKGDTRVPAGSGPNHGKFVYNVPKKMKTGTYQVLVTQAGEEVNGPSIVIAPKIPMMYKFGAVAAAGVITYVIIDLLNKPESFPEPPDLTGN